MAKCSQDHKKITAGSMPGIGVWCGVCGVNLSKDKKYFTWEKK